MKLILGILFLCFFTATFAQSLEPVIEQNGVNNTNSNQLNSAPQPGSVQSNDVELEESIQVKKKTESKQKANTKTQAVSKESKSKDLSNEKVVKEQTISVSSTKFVSQKKQAATQITSRSPSAQQQEEMNTAVKNLELYAPQSFEYNYFKYVSGNYNISLFPYLEKAEKMKPDNIDVQIQLVAYYVITKQNEKAKTYLSKLFGFGKIDSDGLSYGANILASVPNNGYLLTHGFEDTYSVMYQQLILNTRNDVQLISLDFAQSEEYRKQLTSRGFYLPQNETIDNAFFQQLCKFNVNKKLYISMTFPKPYLQGIQDNLYVVGLTFAYRNDPISTFDDNKKLFDLTVRKYIDQEVVSDKAKSLSANYLPMLFVLRNHYFLENNQTKLKEVDSYIDKIGIYTNKRTKIESLKK